MADEKPKKKPGFQFNIIKNDPLDGHRGQNFGSISLENIAPIYINIETKEAVLDIGGLHGKAEVEKRVKWITDKTEAEGEDAKEYYLVWIAVEREEIGPVYNGAGACYLMVNKEKRRGYKMMHEHVNGLDDAMKGRIKLDLLDQGSKDALIDFLQNHNEEMWSNSIRMREALGVES